MTSRSNDVNKYFVHTDLFYWDYQHDTIVAEKDRRIMALEATIEEIKAQQQPREELVHVLQEKVSLLEHQIQKKDASIQMYRTSVMSLVEELQKKNRNEQDIRTKHFLDRQPRQIT